MRKILRKMIFGCMAGLSLFLLQNIRGYAAQTVVVLDPGHGGENLGAQYGGYTEKYMTMAVAEAMKQELEKYEGIQVYVTRKGDEDISLEKRAEFAASKDADFLFCLHFNSSLEQNLFGSEVWISAFGEAYQKGYAFASEELELLEDFGTYPRGIKTRLNEDGEDYYGIIRHCTARGIPSALIEHCHLDQEKDMPFYTSEEKLRQLGVLDATAVAKYFGLRSETLGVDYSGHRQMEIPFPDAPVKPDLSKPDVCIVDVEKTEEETGDVTVSVYAADYDSYILYYSYSWDGGEHFSDLQEWEPRSKDVLTFSMQIPSGTVPDILVRVYNKYDIFTESAHVFLPAIVYGEEGQEEEKDVLGRRVLGKGHLEEENQGLEKGNGEKEDAVEAGAEVEPRDPEPAFSAKQTEGRERKADISYFLQVSLICTSILFLLFLLAGLLMKGMRSKKKRRRK